MNNKQETKRNKIIEFFKKHGLKIAAVACIAGGGVVGAQIWRKGYIAGVKEYNNGLYESLKKIHDYAHFEVEGAKEIDEAVFTELAPTIKDAILDTGVEKFGVSRSYDLGNNVHKLVEVSVESVFGD